MDVDNNNDNSSSNINMRDLKVVKVVRVDTEDIHPRFKLVKFTKEVARR